MCCEQRAVRTAAIKDTRNPLDEIALLSPRSPPLRRRSLPLHTNVKPRVHDEYLSEDIWISGTGPCEGYLSDLVTFRKFTICAAKFTRIFTRLLLRRKKRVRN